MRKKPIGLLSNDNAKSSPATAYQRGNNRDGSPHYVFLYSDDDGGDDDDDESNSMEKIPLQSRKNKSSEKNIYPRKVEVITVTLKPEDSLQALSLNYRCTISELKRINNIHKENEIFARRFIKVPVNPFSIFTEIKENEELKNNSVTIDDTLNNDVQEQIVVHPLSSNDKNNSDTNDINNIILNSSSINPVINNLTNDNLEVYDDDEYDELLINERDRDSTPEARVVELFRCSGADWGLTWIHLLGVSLLLGIVLPIIYIIFVTENQYKHMNNTNST